MRLAVAVVIATVVQLDGFGQTTPPSPSLATVRLLHWNVHHGGIGSDGTYDPVRIATWIAKMTPDIASLNEVDTQAQVDAIVNSLASRTGVAWNVSFSGRGNLVISRLPMTVRSKCLYAPSYGAYAAHAGIPVNGKTINVWASHLHVSSASARLAETKAMQACAQQWPEARILAGDYNMQYGSPEYTQSIIGYTDAWLAAKAMGKAINYSGNCDGCTRNSRIDYVFTSRGAWLTVRSAEVFDTRDANGIAASDHKPLLVVYDAAPDGGPSSVQNLRFERPPGSAP